MEKICGIYCIKNLATGKYYVGKSIDIYGRIYEHFHMLRSGRHHSIKLQRSYDLHGEESFCSGVIDSFSYNDLDEMERKYVDLYDSYYNGYNSCIPTGENCGRVYTDIDKKVQSAAMKLARSRDSLASRNKILSALERGRRNSNHTKLTDIKLYVPLTMELVAEFSTILDCANFLGVSYSRMYKTLYKLRNNSIKTYKGYLINRTNNTK